MIAFCPGVTTLSPCRRYRYTLWRQWGDLFGAPSRAPGKLRYVNLIGLNPSTADEVEDDPTLRRCMDFAARWGFHALCLTNLFAWRATDPEDLFDQASPVGDDNDRALMQSAAGAGLVVAAWGNHGAHLGRADTVRRMLPSKLQMLRLTKEGQPSHPLYLPASLTPQPWA